MAVSLGGVLFPIYAGKWLDHSKDAADITAGYGALFTLCTPAYVIAFALHHMLAPKFEPVRMA